MTTLQFTEFLEELDKLAERHEPKVSVDETPTTSDFDPPIDNDFSEDYEPSNEPEKPSLLEEVVSNFLETCADESKLPTLEETQVILALDALISKYNR
jgi:hypothetical protein